MLVCGADNSRSTFDDLRDVLLEQVTGEHKLEPTEPEGEEQSEKQPDKSEPPDGDAK